MKCKKWWLQNTTSEESQWATHFQWTQMVWQSMAAIENLHEQVVLQQYWHLNVLPQQNVSIFSEQAWMLHYQDFANVMTIIGQDCQYGFFHLLAGTIWQMQMHVPQVEN